MDPSGSIFWSIIANTINAVALNIVTQKLFGKKVRSQSPTYSFGALSTQCDNTLPLPMVYGRVKMAGNIIWSSGEGETQHLLVGFGLGPIKGFSDVRLNDIPIEELPGCNYTPYLGDGEQAVDPRVGSIVISGDWANMPFISQVLLQWLISQGYFSNVKTEAERAEIVGGLKYDAYLAITAKASEKLSGNINVTAIVEGRIVRIYSDPETYTEAWSDNPAWCTLDFEMSDNGCGMEESNVDIQQYVNAAVFCDEMVGDRKRFTLNLTLDEQKSRQDWLMDMLFCYRAYPTYQRGKHGIFVEKPEPVSQVFNIQPDEEISFSWSELGEEIERLRLTYIDPDYEWVKVEARAEAAGFRGRLPVEKAVEAYGITNFPQASRMAWFYQNLYTTCKQSMTYRTNRRALNRTIGDRIQTNDPIMELESKDWRILSMTETQDGKIEMTCREYNEALYTDAMGSVAPTINVTKITGHYVAPAALTSFRVSVSGGNVVFNWSGLPSKADGVEIRRGSSFASGQLVAKVTREAIQATAPAILGTTVYWVAAYNTGGYGEAISDSIAIDAISERVAVLDRNDYQHGAAITGNGALRGQTIVQNSALTYDDIKDKTYNELRDLNLLAGAGAGVVITGALIDLGKIADVVITPQEKLIVAPDQPIVYEIKTSIDGSLYGDWKILPPGKITARYIKLRATITGQNTVGLLDRIDVKITAEKMIKEFIDAAIAVGGTNFIFVPEYVNKPAITVSSNGAIRKIHKTDESRSGFKLQLFDNADTDVGGIADIIVSGF